MKNYKIIPLLAIAAFMTACNTSNSAAKAPSFAKMGKELEFEEWAENVSKPDLLGAWSDPQNQHLPSAIAKHKNSKESVKKITSKKKVVSTEKQSDSETIEAQIDMNNLVVAVTEKSTSSTDNEHQSTFLHHSETEEFNGTMQFNTLPVSDTEDGEFLVETDKLMEQYSIRKNVTGYTAQEKKATFEEAVFQAVSYIAIPTQLEYILATYNGMSVEEKEHFKFYQNNKIFTLTYNSEYSEAYTSGDNVLRLETTTWDEKYQLDASKGESFSFKVSRVQTVQTKFYKDCVYESATRYLGDTAEFVEKTFVNAEVKAQNVNVKPLDISNFKEYNPTI